MIDYNDDMDQNWKLRLERQRIQDAWEKAQWDRTERRVMTIIWTVAFLLLLIIGAGVIVALRQSKAASVAQPGSLTIIVPASTPTPTPEAAEPTLFGTAPGDLKARMLSPTEPPTLRTVQNHPPSARTVKTVPRSVMEPSPGGPWHRFLVTAYSNGCTNPRSGREPKHPQRQSSGSWPVPNWTVAAPPDMAPGTVIELSYRGILTTRIVGDTGPDIVRKPGRLPRLDLFMADCERANAWGHHVVDVREIRRPMGGKR